MDDSLGADPYLCYAINMLDAAKTAFAVRVAQEHARIDADPAYQYRPDLREWLKN